MDYRGTITIKRSVNEVWAFFQEPRNDFAWQADLLQHGILYESPTVVGSRGREIRKSLGESTWEVTEFIPEQRIAYKSISSSVPYQGAYLFEGVEGGTTFTSEYHLELSGLSSLLAPIVRHFAQKQLATNLDRLKWMLEM